MQTTITCPTCGTDYESAPMFRSHTGALEYRDSALPCPKCGRHEDEAVPAWRKGWDYAEAEEIAQEAVKRGLDAGTLSDEQAVAIADELF